MNVLLLFLFQLCWKVIVISDTSWGINAVKRYTLHVPMQKIIIIFLSKSHITPMGRATWKKLSAYHRSHCLAVDRYFWVESHLGVLISAPVCSLDTPVLDREASKMLTSVFTSIFKFHRELSCISSHVFIGHSKNYLFLFSRWENKDLGRFSSSQSKQMVEPETECEDFFILCPEESDLFLKLL